MTTTFPITAPHKEAVALITGKRPVAASVFYGMLPELRARAFTVSGVEGANALQRIRDAVASVPQGMNWEDAKADIADELEPFLGEEGAKVRAGLVLRTNTFQAYSASIWRVAQEDEDTTHLQYIHGDQAKDPTPSHLALDGIVLPKDDPFWETHYGPWGHIGCVCYARPMNPDMVAEEQAKDDAEPNPENKNILDGAALKALHNDEINRNGQHHMIDPPTGPAAFRFRPDNLRLPLADLLARYDAETRDAFELWARKALVGEHETVWKWLKGKAEI